METIKIYNEKELKDMSPEKIEGLLDEFIDIASEYSHLLLRIAESKGA